MSDTPSADRTPTSPPNGTQESETRRLLRLLYEGMVPYNWIGPELMRLTGREVPSHPTEWLALASEFGYQGGYDPDRIAIHAIGQARKEERLRATTLGIVPAARDSRAATPQARRPKGESVNDKLRRMMDSNEDGCVDWTAEQFAERLGCGKSTVVESEAWDTLMGARAYKKADELIRRRGKPIDRRRKPKKKRSDAD
jgi:hypothetical protein